MYERNVENQFLASPSHEFTTFILNRLISSEERKVTNVKWVKIDRYLNVYLQNSVK